MKHRVKLIHGVWAIVCVIAFGIGSLSSPHGDAINNPTDKSSAAGSSGSLTTADNARTSSGTRRTAAAPESLIATLFGSKSAAAGIDALVIQALRDPNPIMRRLAFAKLLEAMTPENAQQIRAQLVSIGADADQWRDFHYAWGALAGQDAFTAATDTKEHDLADTFAGWAAAKPEEALNMLRNLPAALESQRDELTRGVVQGLIASNPALAADFVVGLGQQGNKEAAALMELVAKETLRSDGPEAASQWSESLPDGPLKAAAMGRIATDFARRDPAAAAAWAQRHASNDYATRAIERISGQWVAQDPQAAVGWLETLPPGNGQAAGLQTAFNDWEDRDPAAASEYLLAMPSSPQRDKSISGFANGYAWQNPQLALQWANEIADASLRQQTLTWAAQIYYRQNPTAARAWLDSSNLPPETQQQILNPPRR